VAGGKSQAFVGCSDLDKILHDLEGRKAPTQKPQAKKKKKKQGIMKRPASKAQQNL